MKKLSKLLICLLLVISLFGCTGAEQEKISTAADASQNEIKTTSNSVDKGNTILSTAKMSTKGKEPKKTEQPLEEDTASSKKSSVPRSTQKTTAEKNTAKPAEKAAETTEKQTERVKNQNEKAKTVQASKPIQTTKQEKSITCTVTVECTQVLDHLDDLKAGHEKYLHSNGIFLNSASVSAENGITAFDAVELACDKNAIKMTVTKSAHGKYITGFNNIDEKDCGKQSGWLYTVNGSSPAKSCDKYILKNGDSVRFYYVCSY